MPRRFRKERKNDFAFCEKFDKIFELLFPHKMESFYFSIKYQKRIHMKAITFGALFAFCYSSSDHNHLYGRNNYAQGDWHEVYGD